MGDSANDDRLIDRDQARRMRELNARSRSQSTSSAGTWMKLGKALFGSDGQADAQIRRLAQFKDALLRAEMAEQRASARRIGSTGADPASEAYWEAHDDVGSAVVDFWDLHKRLSTQRLSSSQTATVQRITNAKALSDLVFILGEDILKNQVDLALSRLAQLRQELNREGDRIAASPAPADMRRFQQISDELKYTQRYLSGASAGGAMTPEQKALYMQLKF